MVKLLSIGTALPAGRLEQKQAFEQARSYNCTNEREERVLQKLYRRTLIQSRSTIFAGKNDQPDSHTNGSYSASSVNSGNAAHLANAANLASKSRATIASRLDDFYPVPASAGDTTSQCPICRNAIDKDCQPSTAARMARYKKEITPLAIAAASKALARIDLPATAINNLVTVSCTGFFAPGLDTEIIESLSLSRSVSRTHVGFMGCHGALNGLRVGSALARETRSVSLVVAAELCSLHFQYGRKSDDLLANALFADGAAAALLAEDSLEGAHSLMPPACYSLTASSSYLLPDSREAMTWQVGDHGFSMTLGAEVPSLIEEHLGPWLTGWLDSFGLTIGDVGSWAVHPGGPRVLDAVEQSLGLEGQALAPSRHIFTSLGNMSSPTILFILERLAAQQASPPVVALAFGPGLTIEAALLH